MSLGCRDAEAVFCGILTPLWLLKWSSHFWMVPKETHLGKTHSAREVVRSMGQLFGAVLVCTNIGLINAWPTLAASRIPSISLHWQDLLCFFTKNSRFSSTVLICKAVRMPLWHWTWLWTWPWESSKSIFLVITVYTQWWSYSLYIWGFFHGHKTKWWVPQKRLHVLSHSSQPMTALELTHLCCSSSERGLLETMTQLCLCFFHIATLSDRLSALSWCFIPREEENMDVHLHWCFLGCIRCNCSVMENSPWALRLFAGCSSWVPTKRQGLFCFQQAASPSCVPLAAPKHVKLNLL